MGYDGTCDLAKDYTCGFFSDKNILKILTCANNKTNATWKMYAFSTPS